MNASEVFAYAPREMVDYVADYLDGVQDRPPLAQVLPGYLKDLIPSHAPEEPDKWEDVFCDIERVIMPGVRMTINYSTNY